MNINQDHIPVLFKEALSALDIKPKGIYLDCTFGRGGHSQGILEALSPLGKLYGIDQDPTAIAVGQELTMTTKNANFKILEGNFRNLTTLLTLENITAVDGIFFDLGVSSPQFDRPERGFSYRFEGPLDMRMDFVDNDLTAAQVVNTYPEAEISRIIQIYGQEPAHKLIAKAIVENRPLQTTLELVEVIKKALPAKMLRQKGHPAKKTFQALRIYVNQEMESLTQALEQSLALLKPQGRLVIITFHSLEEKIVKTVLNRATYCEEDQIRSKLPIALAKIAPYELVIKKPLRPSEEELIRNPRAHSAKLWVLVKR
ncbi:16S rRNA (cytosine1402-N4)-methyltransferase [Entomoplasma freundtii]|uniref:Ribosomal RNA small subunit methyltransferase H n=1 Tax=Entomoplasma freundtii TaxID=74700 RepID=A0A2K8NSI4_9MOLU|nr:16S rRNA (cytosine(1402)-N(4))-methyltransferase RsmH [Entomoplasma freundtii]ATZ16516.1 16S rRNA (cytosine1402-N4)-methyltransferase [Entomoplasma freundtii]TDY56046.1 16S rRNA (cytosine1402-N4)-methyltransferase [Entomoplasma freundtii]